MGGVTQSKSAVSTDETGTSIWLHYTGETVGPFNRSDGHRVKIFEESVTFVAQLHPEDQAAMVPPLDRNWMIGSWRIPEYQIPVIVGVSLGVLFLLLAIAVLIIWRCCRLNRLREKTQYDNNGEEGRMPAPNSVSSSSYPSLVMMPIESKQGSPTLTARSHTEITHCETVRLTEAFKVSVANDIHCVDGRYYIEEDLPIKEERRSCEDMSQVGYGHYVAFDLPEFETSMSTSTSSDDVTWAGSTNDHPDFKTRSLPACVKNKTLTTVTVNVNGYPPKSAAPSNKGPNARKSLNVNRRVAPGPRQKSARHKALRNNAAALIALSKTTSTCDANRVSLVSHNKAVIIFNERTAL